MMLTLVLVLFFLLLLLIFIYSLVQLSLLLKYLKQRKEPDTSQKWHFSEVSKMPVVTIQLPVYNEKPVIERLLKNIVKIDYPKEKLEIQVLDDSTDDSVELTSRLISEIQNLGINMLHLRRKNRKGFKAGALKEGLASAKGDFIAIFDSDFIPSEDWLKQTLPYFKDPKLGVVQTRWGHLNRNYSVLTQLQAFLLDFHFILEQNGRNAGNHFINFNGTAGVWRKECILEAGNWQGDTLTEDLDLSYRAQLKGWKFKYLEKVETPAELPVTLAAARSQQFRWNKGAAENFQKNYKKMLFAPGLSLETKLHGFFHLLNSSLFFLVFLMALLSLPLLFLEQGTQQELFLGILTFFSLSTLIFFISYWTSFSKVNGNSPGSFFKFCGTFFLFFSIAMGLSFHNSIAVLQGHLGKKSEFIRTPKFNLQKDQRPKKLGSRKFSIQLLLEIILMLSFGTAIVLAFKLENYSLLVFHVMLFLGFAFVVLTSLNIRFWRPHRFPKPVRSKAK